jgi:hypothetical protein
VTLTYYNTKINYPTMLDLLNNLEAKNGMVLNDTCLILDGLRPKFLGNKNLKKKQQKGD